MRTAEEIYAIYTSRRNDRGDLINRMHMLRDAYNGDLAIPLPEMSKTEGSSIANLISVGLDQSAMRIASVMPNPVFSPSKISVKRAEKAAKLKRDVCLAWWYENRLKIKMRRRARWLIGYACAPVVVRPDWKKKIPVWSVRDPLSTYPASGLDPDELTPPDCIFSYKRSYAWCRVEYPEQAEVLRNWNGERMKPDHKIELLEYIDGEERVLVAVGGTIDATFWLPGGTRDTKVIELDRAPNYIGMCWAVIPGRITLDEPKGQFDGVIGMYQMAAKLMALQYLATVKGIFADTYLVSRQGEQAAFIAGPFDGKTGKVNIVKGGVIQDVRPPPEFQSSALADRIERAMRVTGGVPADFGGESQTNVRTGRRGDAILSAVVDFPIQESQEMFQLSLQEENRIAIRLDKELFNRPKSFHVQWKGATKGQIDYTPGNLWDNDINFVTYAHAGADINGLIVGLGQRVGIGMMSVRSAQEMDPTIEDPELEHDRITIEGIEKALLSQIQTLASQPGGIPPGDLANLIKYVKFDRLELAEAVIKVQEEAQKRQASIDAEGAPIGVDPMSPEAQPGIAMPGQGAEGGPPPTVNQPGEGQANLAQLLNQMRGARQEMAAAG